MSQLNTNNTKTTTAAPCPSSCMVNRREFLLYSGVAASAASTITLSLTPGEATAQQARVVSYPRKFIAKLSELEDNVPVDFNYPDEGLNSACMVVKMAGVKAGGGIGSQQDVVAYSYLCTHQGGPMQGTYKATSDGGGEHRTIGPCPLHLSLYDLRRHGIIVSGQAYQSLPQIVLELEGDDIYAAGILGLLFGRHENLIETEEA